MYIIDLFKNLFKKESVGQVIYFVLNVLIIGYVLHFCFQMDLAVSILLGVLLFGVSLCLLLSPIGEWLLRLRMGTKKFEKDMFFKHKDIYSAYEEVYSKAYAASDCISDQVKLYYVYDDSINAFALGRKTIALTTGAIENASIDEIKGILGHEFGHLSHKDTDVLLLISVSNVFVNLIIFSVKIVIIFFQILFTLLSDIYSGEHAQGMWISKGFNLISNLAMNLVTFIWDMIGSVLVLSSSRAKEYLADHFSVKIGYGKGLLEFLTRDLLLPPQNTFFKSILSTHPSSEKRIQRINTYFDNESYSTLIMKDSKSINKDLKKISSGSKTNSDTRKGRKKYKNIVLASAVLIICGVTCYFIMNQKQNYDWNTQTVFNDESTENYADDTEYGDASLEELSYSDIGNDYSIIDLRNPEYRDMNWIFTGTYVQIDGRYPALMVCGNQYIYYKPESDHYVKTSIAYLDQSEINKYNLKEGSNYTINAKVKICKGHSKTKDVVMGLKDIVVEEN